MHSIASLRSVPRALLGIRGRILLIALVPSLALFMVGAGMAGYLIDRGEYAKSWAAKIGRDSAPGIEFAIQTQEERRLTLLQIAGDEQHTGNLTTQRARVDRAAESIIAAADGFAKIDPTLLADKLAAGKALVAQLPAIRRSADSGKLQVSDAYAYYNQLIGVGVGATEMFPQVSPTPETAADEATASRLLHVAESMSRGNALAAAALTGGGLSTDQMREYHRQVGFYHTEIENVGPHLVNEEQAELKAILTGEPWQRLSAMEDAIIVHGSRAGDAGRPDGLPLTITDWQNAATQVSVKLLDLWKTQHIHALQSATDQGERTARDSLLGGAAALLIAVGAFLIAVRLSTRLVRRLHRLRRDTLALADVQLPRLIGVVRDGHRVDLHTDVVQLDYGSDEIGQVANAFNRAQFVALSAAVSEAKTREGVKSVFLNMAYRNQTVVHRQLEVLDKAEREQEDPTQLDMLFQLDNLSTRARRNAENLVVLGGGQSGRLWRNPIPLLDLIRGAVAETEDYARVDIAKLPAVSLIGSVVADIIHLVAELVDNATSFSPPETRVQITGGAVGRGVAIEIADQGLGMTADEIQEINQKLDDPPDFSVAYLSDDSRLGLFVVARLAARRGAKVRLTESLYGGIRAIVILPTAVLAG